jgi:type II secretory pathway pseudopilin PulG
MIVVAIIGLLAAIAVPAFMKARKNAQRSVCQNNLRVIDSSKDTWAIDYGGTNGSSVTWDQLCVYMKDLTNKTFCPAAAGTNRSPTNYSLNVVGVSAVCRPVGPSGGHSTTNK